MKKLLLILPAMLVMVLMTGCVVTSENVKSGRIGTNDIKIKFVDKPIIWESGKTFIPDPSMQASNPYWAHRNPPSAGDPCSKTRTGCHEVRVKVPSNNEELYGRLHISKSSNQATGPAARSYYIQIPQNYINEASDGKISVVYEWVKYQKGQFKHTGWVLWLSDRPF